MFDFRYGIINYDSRKSPVHKSSWHEYQLSFLVVTISQLFLSPFGITEQLRNENITELFCQINLLIFFIFMKRKMFLISYFLFLKNNNLKQN